MKVHVKIEDKTYEVTVGDLQARPIIASVDGEDLEVWPEEMIIPTNFTPETAAAPSQPIAIPQSKQATSPSESNLKMVHAPLPGVIVDIKVKEGEQVAYGQELCVLEAMKMKNVIRANREGKIKTIYMHVGDQVQHNSLLMEFEE